MDFSERVTALSVAIQGRPAGQLARRSQYEFTYAPEAERAVSLIMPLGDRAFADNELFAVMDMNLPEGFLLARLRERSPKAPPTKMQLLALMGRNGIGRLEYGRPRDVPRARPVSRARLLREGAGRGGRVFRELVDAYLSTGAGLSGVQPKILVPERATIPVPNLLVKVAGRDYPGLAANEFLCLEVARRAGLPVATHELSDDGALLVVDRFDLSDGKRLGFEDIAALMDLRVGGALSDRKYRGSYEAVAALLGLVCTRPEEALPAFFDAVALTALLRNGDGHLKNFAVLYDEGRAGAPPDVWLAPVFDVVTTTIYAYERASGVKVTDRTMALRLRRGEQSRGYPLPEALLRFGVEVCGVSAPRPRVERLLDALSDVLAEARKDDRLPRALVQAVAREWNDSARAWG